MASRRVTLKHVFERLTEPERALLRKAVLPNAVPAMLATLTEQRFSRPDWVFERKLDGVRCLARREANGAVRLLSRNDKDMSRTYPEIVEALGACAAVPLLVDGEVVAFEGRRTSFERLQGRLGLTDPDAARATGIPVFYYVFDVLFLDGFDVRALPLLRRKKLLREAITFRDPLRFTTHRKGAKRAAAAYAKGRSADWLKFKCVRDQEFVIGGWTEPKGSRSGFGALLIGYYDEDTLVYAGKVGTGFGEQLLRRLSGELSRREIDHSPFGRNPVRERTAHWVRPDLVAQIGFTEWTRDGMLRHPRFQGLRNDKPATEVVRETR
jgi:bifunctional non-homologous end joining protein LigD